MSFVRLYRIVSLMELRDLQTCGKFRQGPNALEGKWFCDRLEDVPTRAHQLFPMGGFRVVAADLPAYLLDLCIRTVNLDHSGDATYVFPEHVDQIVFVNEVPVP